MEVNGREDLQVPLLHPSGSFIIDIPEKKAKTITFKIGGINCASCQTSIESALLKVNGIESVSVSCFQGQAKKIKKVVEATDFPVREFPEQDIAVCRLRIKGMTCTSFSNSIKCALKMIDGVKKVAVGLVLEQARVHRDPNLTNVDQIIEAIEDAGLKLNYQALQLISTKHCLKLEGVSSTEDVTIIQSILESLERVNHIEMDLTKNRITVTYDPNITGPRSPI
ncbi:unnamed protein product [Dovyalis caffra]|uniref:HMA domain-containing protein n=1 Tax=Dovyalis caffra TaxID=77055 RepID=A0AAV1RUX8_9ROSI|nr:unnamed protein product [Dovyalis caffra]